MRVSLPSVLKTAALSLLCLAVNACTSGGSDDEDLNNATSELKVEVTDFVGLTDENGRASIEFNVPNGLAAARLETFSPAGKLRLLALSGPSGAMNLSNIEPTLSPTVARFSPNVLALPLTTEGIQSGNYTAVFEVSEIEGENANAFVELNARLVTKEDDFPAFGNVKVNVVFVGAVGDAEELRTDLGGAIELARSVMLKANIGLDIKYYEFPGSSLLPDPRPGHALYESLAEQTREFAINIIIAVDVEGIGAQSEQYSIRSEGLYPILNSPRSASVISLLKTAGSDGRFNYDGDGADQVVEDEILLAAEEIAQLIGHALGLAHNVELEGSIVTGADNISDTPSCIGLADCQQEKSVRENFMCPYPLDIPDEGFKDFERANLTAGQAERMQRSIFID